MGIFRERFSIITRLKLLGSKNLIWDWRFWYLTIFISPLIVNPSGLFPYEIPKQVFLILMIIFVVLYFVISGRNININFNKNVFYFVGLWLLSLIISTLFGVAPLESFWGSTERMQGLFTWILYLIHFFVCLQIFNQENFKRIFFNLVICVGIILSIYAILQYFKIDPLNISDINDASGRSFATIGQPSLLGQWLIFPFIILFIKIFETGGWEKRGAFISLLSIIGLALFTTLNRASILGIILSLVLFFIHKFKQKISIKISITGVIILFFIVFSLISLGGLRSINSRLNLVKPIVPLIENHWLIGTGPETMYQTYQQVLSKDIYLTENLYDIPDRIHNETVQVLLDQGFIGLFLYLFVIWFLIKMFFKKETFTFAENVSYFSIIAYFISVQFSFSVSSHVLILFAMFAVFLCSKLKFFKKIIKIRSFLMIATFKVIILSVSVFYLYNGLAILKSDILFQKGLDSYFDMDGDSIKFFDSALKLNNHSRYYLYHASNLLSVKEQGNPQLDERLKKYLADLGKLTNYSYHYDLAMAKYYDRKNDPKQKEVYFLNASQKAPNWPLVYQQWGMDLFENENYQDAIKKYEKLMDLAPPYWTWSGKLDDLNFEDKEKYRLFKKNHELFYMAMRQLASSYKKAGETVEAEKIDSYLK